MFSRALISQLAKRLIEPRRFIQIVAGPRQTGKTTAVEVKSGRVKNTGGSLVFKKLYPEAFSLIIGSANFNLEDFLSGKVPLFL